MPSRTVPVYISVDGAYSLPAKHVHELLVVWPTLLSWLRHQGRGASILCMTPTSTKPLCGWQLVEHSCGWVATDCMKLVSTALVGTKRWATLCALASLVCKVQLYVEVFEYCVYDLIDAEDTSVYTGNPADTISETEEQVWCECWVPHEGMEYGFNRLGHSCHVWAQEEMAKRVVRRFAAHFLDQSPPWRFQLTVV
eukprot:1551047-Amphidinium_carterae.2